MMSTSLLSERSCWPRLLLAVPAAQVKRCAEQLTEGVQVVDLAPPRSGLGLLQLRDSALGDAYFLGELPIARAHLRLVRPDGASCEGAAQLMDDRASLARAIAILDAWRAAGWPAGERIDALLAQGQAACTALDDARRAMLAATRVNFSSFDGVEDDDE